MLSESVSIQTGSKSASKLRNKKFKGLKAGKSHSKIRSEKSEGVGIHFSNVVISEINRGIMSQE